MTDKTIVLKASGSQHPEITITVDTKPRKAPDSTSKHIVVVGGGVSGLMTAWILLDQGYRVTIISKEWAWTSDFQHSRLTSQIAGALWEFPPGGCGLTEIASPGPRWAEITHYREWALESYEFYQKMNSMLNGRLRTEFGASVKKLNQFFFHDLSTETVDNKADYLKLEEIKIEAHKQDKRIDNLKIHDTTKIQEVLDGIGVDKEWQKQLKYGYTHDAPIVNTDKAMVFLMTLVMNKGADLETKEFKGKTLVEYGSELKEHYGADAIVNATGLGAKELAADEDVYPVRGAVKRIDNNETENFQPLNEAYLVPAQKGDDGQPTKVVFLVPRNDDTLITGSIIQPYNDQLDLTANSPEVEGMWKRARTFLPALNDAHPVAWYPLAQGLRPFTKKNVKVRAEEAISTVPIIHNYGHGGSGWTLAIGCARSAVYLLESILKGKTAKDANDLLYPAKP